MPSSSTAQTSEEQRWPKTSKRSSACRCSTASSSACGARCAVSASTRRPRASDGSRRCRPRRRSHPVRDAEVAELATVIRSVDAVLPHAVSRVDIGMGPDGTIAAIGAPGSLSAAQTVDGTGLIAVPGGIDLHVHINTFFGGTTTRDDFATGSSAALLGGTTTLAQFAIPRPGETTLAAIERTHGEARDAIVSDYVVHASVVRETYEASLEQLPALAGSGVGTVKIFTAYTDAIGLTMGQVHRLLRVAAGAGVLVFVHAETDSLVREGIDDAVRDVGLGPRGHARSRTA